MSLEQRQDKLNVISDQCKLPRSTLMVAAGDEVLMRPDAKTDYKNVDCAVEKLKRLPGLGMKMGFVGNEAYADF